MSLHMQSPKAAIRRILSLFIRTQYVGVLFSRVVCSFTHKSTFHHLLLKDLALERFPLSAALLNSQRVT